MIVLVCGDREWKGYREIHARLSLLPRDTLVIHGAARGADTEAAQVAFDLGFDVIAYPAKWHLYRRAAGPIRNREMLDVGPDLVIAFHDYLENSKGTKDCVTEARKRGIPVEVITHDEHYALP